jgi:hypothetical protein
MPAPGGMAEQGLYGVATVLAVRERDRLETWSAIEHIREVRVRDEADGGERYGVLDRSKLSSYMVYVPFLRHTALLG